MEMLFCEDSRNELWNAGTLKLVTTICDFIQGVFCLEKLK